MTGALVSRWNVGHSSSRNNMGVRNPETEREQVTLPLDREETWIII